MPIKRLKQTIRRNKFIVWLGVVAAALFISRFIPLRHGYLGGGNLKAFKNRPWLYWLANFDGAHYISIARRGYVEFQQAFFPFYPYLIKIFSRIFGSGFNVLFYTGVAVSLVSFSFFDDYLKKLAGLDFNKADLLKTRLIYLFYPVSFFFIAVYTESLFLFLTVAAFYFHAKKKYLWFIFCSALASATRLIGVFIPAAIFLEYVFKKIDQNNNLFTKKTLKKALRGLFASSGLLYYMIYLWQTKKDPLYFFHVQPHFGANRTGGKLILFHQVVWRYLKIFFTANPRTVVYYVSVLEFLITFFFIGVLVWAAAKKQLKLRYIIYSACVIFLPTFTGTLSSMPRYLMSAFPLFFVLSRLKKKYYWLVFIIFTMLLIVNVVLFSRGYFIS